MPKRTNAFQALIVNIYKQMANSDDSVTESVIFNEPRSGTPREVDVLLEKSIFGTTIRIAVECRDRSAKDDIQWIDGLIGKYRDLPINKIVAVSKSGFSKAAQAKANAHQIDTLTLKAALETNWPSEFTRLGMASITQLDYPQKIHVITEPNPANPISLSTPLYTENGEYISTVEEAGRWIYEHNKENITKKIGKLFLSFFKTLRDLEKNKISVEIHFPVPNPIFIDEVAQRLEVKQIVLVMLSSFSYQISDATHYTLGDKQITETIIADKLNGDFSIRAIQEAKTPGQARVQVEKMSKQVSKKSRKRKS